MYCWEMTNLSMGLFHANLPQSCCPRLVAWCVQNPVVTACWTSAINQLMVTPLSLVRDAEPFCKSPLHNRVFLLVSATFVILGTLGVLAGPAHKANIFHMYLFPQSFRVDQYALLTLAAIVYIVIMTVMKHIVRMRQQRRVAAA